MASRETGRERMMRLFRTFSDRELVKHPDSGGWVEEWDVFEPWGTHLPLCFVPNAARKCCDKLAKDGELEPHPELVGLWRPKVAAL